MSRASLQDSVNPKPLMVGIAEEHPRQLALSVGTLSAQGTSSAASIMSTTTPPASSTPSSAPSSPSSGNSIRFGSFEFTPHTDSSRSVFSGLRGGLDMTFGSVHYCVDAEGILRLPDPFAPSTSKTATSSTAASTASSPITVDLSAALSASTPTSSPSTSSRRSTSSMSVGSDDSASSDLTSYYCLNCDTRHGLGSDDTPFVCSARYSSDEESIGSIARAAT